MVYAPGTLETDPKKQNMALQQHAASIAANAADIATLQSGTVTTIAGNSGAFTLNSTSGITNATNDIKLQQASSTQFGAVKVDGTTITASSGVISAVSTAVSASPITSSLGADVLMNNTANYFDGPSIAQGSTGTWFVSGTVTMVDTAGVAAFIAKLWDGTTVIASGRITSTGAGNPAPISLSGYIASPAGNLRISCRDSASTSGKIVYDNSGNAKDSTITAFRIA
jgi:hypothetical protein